MREPDNDAKFAMSGTINAILFRAFHLIDRCRFALRGRHLLGAAARLAVICLAFSLLVLPDSSSAGGDRENDNNDSYSTGSGDKRNNKHDKKGHKHDSQCGHEGAMAMAMAVATKVGTVRVYSGLKHWSVNRASRNWRGDLSRPIPGLTTSCTSRMATPMAATEAAARQSKSTAKTSLYSEI